MSAASFDFADAFLALTAAGGIDAVARGRGTPRLDGFTIGVWETDAPAGHQGEMHPDGDEFLYVLDGRIDVEFYDTPGQAPMSVEAGRGCIVPRGSWHKVIPRGRCRLLHITPGPGIEFRRA